MKVLSKFERLLKAAHYSSVRCASKVYSSSILGNIILKTSVSLLRFTDILLADRCYYEAGMEARNTGLSSEAFVFLNHFLDLEECVEEGDGSVLDVEELRVTDFPLEVPLPSTLSLTAEQREEVREWVLTISVDQKVEQGLPVDQRGVYVGSLTSHVNEVNSLVECVLTGYPIRGASVQFEGNRRAASKEDWNKFVGVAKQSTPDSDLNDIISFVQDWCGVAPSYTF